MGKISHIMKIKIPTRLHLTLISLHDNGYRQNGGIGFAIDTPSLEISFKNTTSIEINDERTYGFNTEEKTRIVDILNKEKKRHDFSNGYTVTIIGDVPTHMGFGSSTAVRLALIEGLYLVNKFSYTEEDIVKASERGGVSGIGIETYFEGGMVFDMGSACKSDFVPSSSMEKEPKILPLVCKYISIPSWKIGICIPDIEPKTESEEKAFFNETCPIKESESYKVLYHVTYGVLASVMENDRNTFAKAIKEIQKCQWKKAERSLYGNELIDVENVLYECGAEAVGMSSLGPTLFFVAKDIEKVVSKSKVLLPKSQLFVADVNNNGRSISYD